MREQLLVGEALNVLAHSQIHGPGSGQAGSVRKI